jgi:transcriptional regulator with GAF, ATPase, and Fis domain
MEKNEMERENRAMVEAFGQGRTQTIISHSPEMEKVLSMAARAAQSDSTVLISGESGTGKELVARAIHLAGPRKHKAFVPVNIAALQENLIESELFGHVKGAFTGAMADRTGRFALANGGTLFIDEIGEVPSGIQVKLLRVLQFGSFERVGENTPRDSDVRIIAATNRDLEAEVRAGRFRADLYYRVNVVPVSLPPLREHRADIPYLVEYFIKKYAVKNRKPIKSITGEAMARIMRYPFPGNVRELENVLERGVVLCRGEYLTETDIFLPDDAEGDDASEPAIAGSYDEAMGNFERVFLSRVLERNAHNKSAAARELGINERRLRYRLKVLGLD